MNVDILYTVIKYVDIPTLKNLRLVNLEFSEFLVDHLFERAVVDSAVYVKMGKYLGSKVRYINFYGLIKDLRTSGKGSITGELKIPKLL